MKYAFLALVCLLAACTVVYPGPATPAVTVESTAKALQLTDADVGRPTMVAVGGEVTVALSGNPTTGYAWTLLSGNDAVLKPEGDPVYSAASAPTGMVGAGGAFIFKFRAIAAGNVTLAFAYRRSWEKDSVLLKTFVVTVKAQ